MSCYPFPPAGAAAAAVAATAKNSKHGTPRAVQNSRVTTNTTAESAVDAAGASLPTALPTPTRWTNRQLETVALAAVGGGAVPPQLCAAAMDACVGAGEWERAVRLYDTACAAAATGAAGGGGMAAAASAPLMHAAMRAFEVSLINVCVCVYII